MWLSKHTHKSFLYRQNAFILKIFWIAFLNCYVLNSSAQTFVGTKQFVDIKANGASITIQNGKIFYSISGDVPSDSNKSYNLNACFSNTFDTLSTNLFYLSNNVPGTGLGLVPFANKSNKLFYWGLTGNYASFPLTGFTYIFANANQTDYSLISHKAYRSKYNHRGNYINTFLNDSTFISTNSFKWSYNSSLPYGASIWWLNQNMDTLQQKVYFEQNGSSSILPTTVFPLNNKDILISGFTDTGYATNYDSFLMRLDSGGNVKYARRIGKNGHENMYLTKIENRYYMIGTAIPSYSNSANSSFYVSEIDVATGDVGNTYKTSHVGTGITLMHNPSVQNDKIYLPCLIGTASAMYRKSCYFLIDTIGVIHKQYIHSQANNGYWNSYTMPTVTDSLKNLFGSIVSYNSNSDPAYTKLFKLDSNLVGCYPSDLPFSFTTTIANGTLYSLPMNIVTAKDSIFEVTAPGAILQGHGFNTMVDECIGYVSVKENFIKNKSFKLYPNPTANYLEIETEGNIDYIKIHNLLGSEVPFKLRSEKNVDVEHLPSGAYFIELKTDVGVLRQKFIKE